MCMITVPLRCAAAKTVPSDPGMKQTAVHLVGSTGPSGPYCSSCTGLLLMVPAWIWACMDSRATARSKHGLRHTGQMQGLQSHVCVSVCRYTRFMQACICSNKQQSRKDTFAWMLMTFLCASCEVLSDQVLHLLFLGLPDAIMYCKLLEMHARVTQEARGCTISSTKPHQNIVTI